MEAYYKIARPDGWDFYTGETINYRQALANGRLVLHPSPNPSLGGYVPEAFFMPVNVQRIVSKGGVSHALSIV